MILVAYSGAFANLSMNVLRVPVWAPSILMVGQVGIEPTVYLTSRFYRPLQSPAMHTDPYMAGVVGFEPTMPVSETGALPLGYTPVCGEGRAT